MVVVTSFQHAKSLEIRGEYGAPCGLGEFYCGWSRVGELDPMAGVYQKRPRKRGQIFVKMRHCIIPNPRTPAQQARREKFAQALLAWRALSFEDQVVWNKKNYPSHMSGYNRFIRHFMKS